MHNCYGDGHCIKWRSNGYFKPFKCPYNCKLVFCQQCRITKMPQYILEKKGWCEDCQKIRYNEKIMNKVF